jgi:hypothetical protein
MKIKQIRKALELLKNSKEIHCLTLEDGEDIEMNFFDPDVEIDNEIPELVIGGVYGNLFTEDFSDCIIEGNTIQTKDIKITIQK